MKVFHTTPTPPDPPAAMGPGNHVCPGADNADYGPDCEALQPCSKQVLCVTVFASAL